MAFPTARGPKNCPIEVCWGREATQTAMRVHFYHLYVRDTVIIMEEVSHTTYGAPGAIFWLPGKN